MGLRVVNLLLDKFSAYSNPWDHGSYLHFLLLFFLLYFGFSSLSSCFPVSISSAVVNMEYLFSSSISSPAFRLSILNRLVVLFLPHFCYFHSSTALFLLDFFTCIRSCFLLRRSTFPSAFPSLLMHTAFISVFFRFFSRLLLISFVIYRDRTCLDAPSESH